MLKIPLTLKQFAEIDDEDFIAIAGYTWCAVRKKHTYYAATSLNGTLVMMHQLLCPHWLIVDHKDRNGLNNTRANLRSATTAQNVANSRNRSNNRSGYKGVGRNRGKWRVRIQGPRGTRIFLGHFNTPELAAHAYDKAALEYFGEFACLNFKQDSLSGTV